MDKSGKVIVKPEFFEARDFSEGLAAVKNDKNRWGYIDKTGKIIVDFQYAAAADFSEGIARIQLEGEDHWNGLTGYIDRNGKTIIKPQFVADQLKMPESGGFSEGLAVVEKNGKMGYVDRTGKVVIEPKYDAAYPFIDGRAAVQVEFKVGFIDKTGRETIPMIYEYGSAPRFSEGLAHVLFKNDNFFIDNNGKEALRSAADSYPDPYPSNFSEGLVAWVFANGKMGYLDEKGKIVVPALFDYEGDFSEGLAAVELNEEYGFIDKTGIIVIEPRSYLYLPQFVNGLARVTTRDFNFGYIDKKGKFVWKSTH